MPVVLQDRQKRLKTDKRLIRRVTEELLAFLGLSDKTLNILFTDDEGIKEFNRRFLKRDRPTNVISFSYLKQEDLLFTQNIMGDIIISLERAAKEAEGANIPFYQRLFELIIHGILHIIGYDHEESERERRRMRYMEKKLMNLLKSTSIYGQIPDSEKSKFKS